MEIWVIALCVIALIALFGFLAFLYVSKYGTVSMEEVQKAKEEIK
jgi:archaellum component FlaF (FlaF/FlaG flagellin family)